MSALVEVTLSLAGIGVWLGGLGIFIKALLGDSR